jgi:hypothetical protein
MFNALNVSKEWNIPQKHRIDACFNCGDPDHGIPKCPKPINQSRIDKARSEFSISGGGRGYHGGGRNGRDGRGCRHGSGRGCGDGNKAIPRRKWKGNTKAVNAVATSNGIGKHKGKWSMMCKSCGWNTTHTTGFHDSYAKDPALLSLPATHLFCTKSGKSPSEKGGRASAPAMAILSVASAASLLSSQMGPLIAQYRTRLDDSEFTSFLADFQRASN